MSFFYLTPRHQKCNLLRPFKSYFTTGWDLIYATIYNYIAIFVLFFHHSNFGKGQIQ